MNASNSPSATRVKLGPDQLMRGTRAAALLIGTPIVLIGASYAALALVHQRLWLWNVSVHESGRYTLGGTIFYFAHFLREVPTDIAMALFLVAALREAGLLPSRHPDALRRWATGLAGMLLMAAFAAAASASGPALALGDLAQFRTRDNLWAYGSHWRFHVLSTIWFAAAAVVVARLAAFATRPESLARHAKMAPRLWLTPWIYFGALTAVFGLSPEFVTDPRFVAHQAREILTHGPITSLLVVGFAVLMAPDRSAGRGTTHMNQPVLRWWTASVFVLIPVVLATLVLTGNAMAAAQTANGLSGLLAAHVFEHVLDYVMVGLVVFGVGNGRGC
jgi:hypothetical protein